MLPDHVPTDGAGLDLRESAFARYEVANGLREILGVDGSVPMVGAGTFDSSGVSRGATSRSVAVSFLSEASEKEGEH